MILKYQNWSKATLAIGLLLSAPTDGLGAAHRKSATGGGVKVSTPNPTNPLEWNNRGVELGTKGLYAEAVHAHETALADDPYNLTFRKNLSAALLLYGKALMAKHNYPQAINELHYALYVDGANGEADDILSNALKLSGRNPDDAAVRLKLADDYEIAGDYRPAIAEYRHYVRMKDSGAAHFGLGRVLMKQGSQADIPDKLVEGFKEMKIAVNKPWEPGEKAELSKCHGQLGETLKELAFKARDDGRAQVAMQRLVNASVEYCRAVSYNPLNTDAINGLVEVAREAVSINPSFANHLMLGGAYQLQPDFEHAKQEYLQCWKLNKNSPDLVKARRSFHLAVVSSSQVSPQMLAETMQKLEDELRSNPNDAELLYIYGRGKEAQGDREASTRAYQMAVSINPNINPQLQPRLNALMGGTALSSAPERNASGGRSANQSVGQKAGAAGSLSPTTQNAPVKVNPALYDGVESKIRAGDYAGAITDTNQLLSKNPQDGHTWMLLGTACEKSNDLESASVNYRQAISLNESAAIAALNRVNTARTQPLLQDVEKMLQDKNYANAASNLRDAIQMAPTMPELHRKLAGILKQMDDNKEADREGLKADELEIKNAIQTAPMAPDLRRKHSKVLRQLGDNNGADLESRKADDLAKGAK